MEAKFFPSHPSLTNMVKGYFLADSFSHEEGSNLLTPNGTAAIVIPFGGLFEYSILDNPMVEIDFESPYFDQSYLFGQMTTYGVDVYKGHFRLLLIVFSPNGLFTFSQKEVCQFTNKVIPINKLNLPVFGDTFMDTLWNNSDGVAVVDLVERELLRYMSQINTSKKKRDIEPIIQEIISKRGIVSISDLGSNLGISQKVLELEFRKQVGLTPKMFSRIVRFNNLMKNMGQIEKVDSLSFVTEMGYTDQSHLIKDYVQFTGLPPLKFLKDPNEADMGFKENNPNWSR